MRIIRAAKQQIYVNIPRLLEVDYHFKGKGTSSGWARETWTALVNYQGSGQFVEMILVDDNGVKIDSARKKFIMEPSGKITVKDSDGKIVEIGKWGYDKDSIMESSDILCDSDWMKVKVYVINKGTPSEYYGLKSADEGDILYGAPNNWKSRKGAERWAEKHGYQVVESTEDIYCETEMSNEDYYEKLAKGVKKEYEDYFGNIYTLQYEISDAAITFIDSDTVIYIQPLEEITPRKEDLNDDIDDLAEAVISAAIPKF